MASKKHKARDDREALADLTKVKGDGIQAAKAQLKTAAKVVAIALLVVWLLAAGFATGLSTWIPWVVAAGMILRNLKKSEALGALLAQGDQLSPETREAELAKLDAQVEKGDAGAILAKAQLQMQSAPRDALATLEKVNLEKAQKLMGAQVRAMRAMIHLNLGEVKAARDLVEGIDLSKAPDPKSRANLSAVVAEAWARTGNPIEASELLAKYDPDDKEFEEVRMQLLRARTFTCAHRQDMNGVRRGLKALTAISPQLPAMFVGQKRIHPLLEKEARKVLERSGAAGRPKIQVARR